MRIKKPVKPAQTNQLADDERELFLNAYFQGGIVSQEKIEKSRIERPVEGKKDAEESEQDLFIRAVNEGLAQVREPKVAEVSKKTYQKQPRKRPPVDATLDLHGMFVENAVTALLRFIEREKRLGAKTLLVIHGKGSGALKQAVWSLIDTHPFVGDFQVAPPKLGGAGAIILRIRRT